MRGIGLTERIFSLPHHQHPLEPHLAGVTHALLYDRPDLLAWLPSALASSSTPLYFVLLPTVPSITRTALTWTNDNLVYHVWKKSEADKDLMTV